MFQILVRKKIKSHPCDCYTHRPRWNIDRIMKKNSLTSGLLFLLFGLLLWKVYYLLLPADLEVC